MTRAAATNPLVSVITPFLNAERFLGEAVESLLAQTYGDWELLLVNDGSTDRSAEIALRFAERFPERVRYFEHPHGENLGVSAARNLGLRHARGDYVAFLDADDVYLPEKLERQVALMEARPETSLTYSATLYWHGWTGRAEDAARDRVWDNFGVEPDTLVVPPRLLTLFLSVDSVIPCVGSFLVRREAVERVGGFEESVHLYEDQMFLAKLCLTEPVYVSSGCWDKYRQHPASSWHVAKARGQAADARLTYLTWLENYLTRQGATGGETWAALQRALFPLRHPTWDRLRGLAGSSAGNLKAGVKRVGRRVLPAPARRELRRWWRGPEEVPDVGAVRWGDLRRLSPVSRHWGFGRGRPVDRYYIEEFLAAHSADIRGRVLEVADDTYTRRFGGDRVTRSDVIHPTGGNPKATIVGDLAAPATVPREAFDCVVCTQTLLLIYDLRAAVGTLHRMLKPGGVLLVTVPGISQISRQDMDQWGDFWRFTTRSARQLFEEFFPAEGVRVETHGNVLAACAFLYGLAAEELTREELDHTDPDYQLTITVRAVKAAGRAST